MAKKILVVDDDTHIREVIRFALENAGMEVFEAANGREALKVIPKTQPHLVIFDIIMPEMDGLEACRELRKTSELPVLFLTSRDDEIDRIVGLEIGGDDYVTKPFSPRELVARVNVILKRLWRAKELQSDSPRMLVHGRVSLNLDGHQVCWDKQLIPLTATEFGLLEILLRHPGRVYSRDELIDSPVFSDAVTDRTIDSHIRRIRRKFVEAGGQSVVDTVHGVGYKLGSCQ